MRHLLNSFKELFKKVVKICLITKIKLKNSLYAKILRKLKIFDNKLDASHDIDFT